MSFETLTRRTLKIVKDLDHGQGVSTAKVVESYLSTHEPSRVGGGVGSAIGEALEVLARSGQIRKTVRGAGLQVQVWGRK